MTGLWMPGRRRRRVAMTVHAEQVRVGDLTRSRQDAGDARPRRVTEVRSFTRGLLPTVHLVMFAGRRPRASLYLRGELVAVEREQR